MNTLKTQKSDFRAELREAFKYYGTSGTTKKSYSQAESDSRRSRSFVDRLYPNDKQINLTNSYSGECLSTSSSDEEISRRQFPKTRIIQKIWAQLPLKLVLMKMRHSYTIPNDTDRCDGFSLVFYGSFNKGMKNVIEIDHELLT